MPRTILHLDLDAFFCAVEELHDPSLRGKPFAVGGRPEETRRGGLLLLRRPPLRRPLGHAHEPGPAPAARACWSSRTTSATTAKCPTRSWSAWATSPPWSSRFPSTRPSWISATCARISTLLARRLQKRVNDELGLPCSVGVASNKLVAKIATEVGKNTAQKGQPPNAVTVVPPGTEAAFLDPLPAEMLWGVGPKTAAKLAGLGIQTIGDIARRPAADLARLFGENGRDLARRARGVDDSPVVTEHEAKSISQETTFVRDVSDDKVLADTVRDLAADVGRRLRKAGVAGTTVKLKLRWPDFTTLTRQVTLPQPTDQDEHIYLTALDLLAKVRVRGQAVRLIGVGVSGLGAPLRQMELWGAKDERSRLLQQALDELQAKFGREAIRRGKVQR